MKLHTLKHVPGAVRRRKRVGCGESSGHGKTSGRGTKGQYGRSGHKYKSTFEGGQMPLIRRMPKRGFNRGAKIPYTPVNLQQLANFEPGSEVTPDRMREAGLFSGAGARVKVLGTGTIDRALRVKAHAFSASAKAKIEAVGGTCEVIN